MDGNIKKYYHKKYKMWVTVTYSEKESCTPEIIKMLTKIATESI